MIEAMKQALEALELARSTHDVMLLSDPPQKAWKYHNVDWKLLGAVNQLRQAIAEAEKQEPFGYVTVRRLSQRYENHAELYAFYPSGQSPYLDNADECHAVYTSPSQRQPLTDEQITTVARKHWGYAGMNTAELEFARAIEAAHGIKGEA